MMKLSVLTPDEARECAEAMEDVLDLGCPARTVFLDGNRGHLLVTREGKRARLVFHGPLAEVVIYARCR